MKNIISILALIAFLWFGCSLYRLFGTSDHFGSAFWTTCLSLSTAIIFTAARIAIIGKTKLSTTVNLLGASLLIFSLIAWWNPGILASTWNYFLGIFVLFIGAVLSGMLPEKTSRLFVIFGWVPWLVLAGGIVLKFSSPLFFTLSAVFIAGGILLNLLSTFRTRAV